MMRKRNSQKLVIGILFLSIFLLGLLQNINIAHAQDDSKTIDLPQNFILHELSEHNGTGEQYNSINISLPSSDWNISDIDLEFEDINFTRQVLDVENINRTFHEEIFKETGPITACSVQIKINYPTRIYSIQIHGRAKSRRNEDKVFLQIRGYNQ